MTNIEFIVKSRREGKSLAALFVIKYALASGKVLIIGTNNVDNLFNKIKELYPEAKLTKTSHGVKIEPNTKST